MALTADQNISAVGVPRMATFSANAADTYFRGSVVFIDTAGGAQVVPAAGDRCVGVSPKNQVIAAAADEVEVIVEGLVWLPVGTNIAAADEGDFLVLDIGSTQSDDPGDFVSATDITVAANDAILGQIMRVTATQMLIAITPGVTGRLYAGTATNLWI